MQLSPDQIAKIKKFEAQKIQKIEAAKTEKEIEKAVASMLGVDDPETIIAASQGMIDIQDDTDLEAAAQFDINQWLEKAQITNTAINFANAASDTDLPTVLRLKALEEVYSVPKSK